MELDCTHSIPRFDLVSLAFSAGKEAKLYIEFCSWKVVARVAWVDPGVRSSLLGGHSRWHAFKLYRTQKQIICKQLYIFHSREDSSNGF